MSLTRNGLTVLGPTLGALLVVTVGAGWALAIDAATWLVAALLLIPVKIPRAEKDAEQKQHHRRAPRGLDASSSGPRGCGRSCSASGSST